MPTMSASFRPMAAGRGHLPSGLAHRVDTGLTRHRMPNALQRTRKAARIGMSKLTDKMRALARRRDIDAVRGLLDPDPSLTAFSVLVGGTSDELLPCLVAKGEHSDCIENLFANGADVNIRDRKGRTALHAADAAGDL